jgi:hypothetical protein
MKRRNFLKLVPGAVVGAVGVAAAPSLLARNTVKELEYPHGTPMCPVDNYEDAKYIAKKYNLHIDEVAIWDRSLSGDEIKWVYDLKRVL